MAQRGRCRCGAILDFQQSEHGYKMRCPECGSVVRLRIDLPQTVPAKPPSHAQMAAPLEATEAVEQVSLTAMMGSSDPVVAAALRDVSECSRTPPFEPPALTVPCLICTGELALY